MADYGILFCVTCGNPERTKQTETIRAYRSETDVRALEPSDTESPGKAKRRSMTDPKPQRVHKITPDLVAEPTAHLKARFPKAVSEGRIDRDRLLAILGDAGALADDTHYTFTWAGKETSFRALQEPSAASLTVLAGLYLF